MRRKRCLLLTNMYNKRHNEHKEECVDLQKSYYEYVKIATIYKKNKKKKKKYIL